MENISPCGLILYYIKYYKFLIVYAVSSFDEAGSYGNIQSGGGRWMPRDKIPHGQDKLIKRLVIAINRSNLPYL